MGIRQEHHSAYVTSGYAHVDPFHGFYLLFHLPHTGFQKQRPITSVATAVEPKVSQPIKSAIKAAAAAAVVPSDGKVNGGSNGQLKKKRKTAATKNGDAKRKKATDFF